MAATLDSSTKEFGRGRAVVLAIGSAGDVAPLAAVAAALARRGPATTLMAPARYRGLCPTGVEFRDIGADDIFEQVFSAPELWTARHGAAYAWKAYGAAATTALGQLLADWSPRDTVLVSSSFAVAARLAEEAHGFRNTSVHLSPAVMFSYRQPPRWPGVSIPHGWPTWAKVLSAGLAERLALDPLVGDALAPAFRLAGLSPRRRLFSQFLHSPQRVAYLFPQWFGPAAEDWPRAGVHMGFPHVAALVSQLPTAVASFVARDDGPLIVLTAGTAASEPPPWVARCTQALTQTGARVLVLGPVVDAAAAADARVLRTTAVPLDRVLPRAQLIVHHGGIGTAVTALRHGTPQWLFPTAHDQPDNAERLATLGVARVWPASASAAQLASAWTTRAGWPEAARLTEFQARIAAAGDGAERVVDAVMSDFRFG